MSDTHTLVRPYGDTTGDGMVQVSFTLPLPYGENPKKAEGAALQLAKKMGMEPALLVHAKAMGPDFTFFVVYGSVSHLVDLRDVTVVEREYPLLSAKEVNLAIKRSLRRKLVVVGACIGTDAHTVGIDAILNIKGFAGEKGLEYYREIRVVNLGAQVLVPELVAQARAERADAVLVSQVVTQKDAHIHNTSAMSAAFREAYPSGQVPLLVVGGPRFEEGTAAALGVDRIFGRGTTPGEVASYLVHELVQADEPPRSAPSSRTGATCPTATPTTRGTSSTGRTRWPRSATSPPRCASGPTGTRGCSPRMRTCSSARRSGPVTSSRSSAGWSGSDAGAGRWSSRSASSPVATRRTPQPSAAEVLDPPIVATTAKGTCVVP